MPTIQCSFTDLKDLYGKKCSLDELRQWLPAAKAELEHYDEKTDTLTIKLGDTNQPYLWSVEGITRFLRHYQGNERGIPRIKMMKTKNIISVDPKLHSIRPVIAAFIAKGKPFTNYLLKQFIQMQEKIADGFGRRRQKVAIGMYPSSKISFPLRYYAADPEKTSFVPLDGTKENLRRILAYHPKGKEYAWILQDAKQYPLLEDARRQIISFPPITNAEDTGRINIGDSSIFFEATGTDHAAVNLVTTIFAYAFAERGFSLQQVSVKYHDKTENTPLLKEEAVAITPEQVAAYLGIQLKKSEIKTLLERAQYDVLEKVKIPPYRGDILHPVDVIEDIGIMYGYDKIEPLPLTTSTVGAALPKIREIEKCRELLLGLGYQEVLSPVLSNKELLCDKMNTPDTGIVEIENFMSQTYSAVRTWILPVLLEMLSKNKHVDYPQRVFEQGIVTRRVGDMCNDEEHLAVVYCNTIADYTEMKQVMDYLFSMLGARCSITSAEHPALIPGRVGDILVNRRKVGFLGELSPHVLEKLDITMPAVCMELNLSVLFSLAKNS